MSECNLKGFQQVLVRDEEGQEWERQFFSYYDETSEYPYGCMGDKFKCCIPYEGNEHLADTSNAYVEPYIPKDGDFVVMYEKFIVISTEAEKDEDGGYKFHAYVQTYLKEDSTIDFDILCTMQKENRPATEEEKQLLLSKLHKIGKDWNEEKKEIVDWKWEPKDGEDFFFPSFAYGEFISAKATWYSDIDYCLNLKSKGYVSRTEEECKTMCDKLNEAIINVK